MQLSKRLLCLLLAAMLASGGCASAPPAGGADGGAAQNLGSAGESAPGGITINMPEEKCCKPSIWDFLGVSQIGKGIAGLSRTFRRLVNRNGNFPGAEGAPLAKALDDPANLESSNPAIQEAAKAKQEENQAPQKMKAIKYLGTLGCGCYPDIQDALLASLEDCNPNIRQAACEAFITAAKVKCPHCNPDSCCSEKVSKKLFEMGWERQDNGCYKDPSPLVRNAARKAFHACNPHCVVGPPAAPEGEGPQEGPTEASVAVRRVPPKRSVSVVRQGTGVFYLPNIPLFEPIQKDAKDSKKNKVAQPARRRGTPTPAAPEQDPLEPQIAVDTVPRRPQRPEPVQPALDMQPKQPIQQTKAAEVEPAPAFQADPPMQTRAAQTPLASQKPTRRAQMQPRPTTQRPAAGNAHHVATPSTLPDTPDEVPYYSKAPTRKPQNGPGQAAENRAARDVVEVAARHAARRELEQQRATDLNREVQRPTASPAPAKQRETVRPRGVRALPDGKQPSPSRSSLTPSQANRESRSASSSLPPSEPERAGLAEAIELPTEIQGTTPIDVWQGSIFREMREKHSQRQQFEEVHPPTAELTPRKRIRIKSATAVPGFELPEQPRNRQPAPRRRPPSNQRQDRQPQQPARQRLFPEITQPAPAARQPSRMITIDNGKILAVDYRQGVVRIRVRPDEVPPVGATLSLFRGSGAQTQFAGELRVVHVRANEVIAVPLPRLQLSEIRPSDQLLYQLHPDVDRLRYAERAAPGWNRR